MVGVPPLCPSPVVRLLLVPLDGECPFPVFSLCPSPDGEFSSLVSLLMVRFSPCPSLMVSVPSRCLSLCPSPDGECSSPVSLSCVSLLCPSPDGEVHDYSVVEEVRNCYLGGLTDLYGSREFVRHRISHYLNDLIDIGVMGFRIDAAKHIWPEDLEAIQSLTNNLNTLAGYPGGRRPFFFQDLVDLGVEPITVDEYFPLGRTTEFRFCTNVAAGVEDFALLEHVYDPNSSMAPPHKALVFVDNHQNQRGDENGHVNVLTYKQDSNQGPPGSDNGGSTDTVPINADGTCGGGWICEHRWNAIMQMITPPLLRGLHPPRPPHLSPPWPPHLSPPHLNPPRPHLSRTGLWCSFTGRLTLARMCSSLAALNNRKAQVLPLGTGYHYEKYDAWRVGDTKLDWYGAQIGQGKYDGRPAEGSPLVWTTNDPNAAEYQPLNTFGPHYWMIDLMMYCDQTDADWFELRSFTTNDEIGWEDDINQASDMCTGDAGSKAPTAGVYHVARCGYLNVFDFQSPSCEIDNLP
ncbi:Pancreatic alpha-amylase-like [Homarus americanus]|uniref:Pancreatic alpha-amylase-like n=1 Tax=Homarus americanus TaxID=6706 RepID=A0A8J5NET3_HOMAM|nr:Pancreatic alpha-amylase-like [Homarus americanus]